MFSLLLVAVTSCALSFWLTPLFRDLCLRRGWVDKPDRRRKLHAYPVPRIGGVPIFIAFTASAGLLLLLSLGGAHVLNRHLDAVLALIPPVTLVFVVGLVDDLFGLEPWQKLLVEIPAAATAAAAGVVIHTVSGVPVPAWLAYPLTILWLIACANAVNLIDGMDGLASGVGLFAAVTTFIAGVMLGNFNLQLATIGLIGALLGFLRYNFNPASVFLGDCGSLTIGFLLGCYGIIWSQKSSTVLGMLAPLLAFSIPLLDTALAIVRRFLRGRPIFSADRRHIHHLLLDRGLTPRRAVLLLYGVCALAACFSLTLGVVHRQARGLVVLAFCLVAAAGIRHLGWVEFNLAGRLARPQTFRRVLDAQLQLLTLENSLNHADSVESCWNAILDVSSALGFDYVSARLDHTVLYHARPGAAAAAPAAWSVHVPLSDEEFVRLEHRFDTPVEPLVVGPLADILRRTLTPKLPAFHAPAAEPQPLKAFAAGGLQ